MKIRKHWMVELGKELRRLRTVSHISQEVLAERVGRSRATIINYETGRELPSLEVLASICAYLGPVTFLIDGQNFEIGPLEHAKKPRSVPKQLRLKLGIVCAADHVNILPRMKGNRLDVEVLSA